MNEVSLMRLRIDYLENKTDLHAEQYKTVILQLILEIERLRAANTAANAKRAFLHYNSD